LMHLSVVPVCTVCHGTLDPVGKISVTVSVCASRNPIS
jgi:hypothetical protein